MENTFYLINLQYILKIILKLYLLHGAIDGQLSLACSTGDIVKCQDCTSIKICASGYVSSCQSNEVCIPTTTTNGQSIDGCVTDDQSSMCACPPGLAAYIADPYNPENYYICLGDGTKVHQTCPDGLVFSNDIITPCKEQTTIEPTSSSTLPFTTTTSTSSSTMSSTEATTSITTSTLSSTIETESTSSSTISTTPEDSTSTSTSIRSTKSTTPNTVSSSSSDKISTSTTPISLSSTTIADMSTTTEGQDTCTESKNYCSDLFTLAICMNGMAPMTIPCSTDTLCGEISETEAACFEKTDATVAADSCESCKTGYMADPYDKTKYVMCETDGTAHSLSCDADMEFNPDTNTCVAVTTTQTSTSTTTTTTTPKTCAQPGFLAVDETCTSYETCIPGGTVSGVTTCPEGQIFNGVDSCVDTATLSAPVTVTCAVDSGLSEYPNDCKAFIMCSGGNPIGAPMCCPDPQVFDSATSTCADSSTCTDANACIASYLTLPCTTA